MFLQQARPEIVACWRIWENIMLLIKVCAVMTSLHGCITPFKADKHQQAVSGYNCWEGFVILSDARALSLLELVLAIADQSLCFSAISINRPCPGEWSSCKEQSSMEQKKQANKYCILQMSRRKPEV